MVFAIGMYVLACWIVTALTYHGVFAVTVYSHIGYMPIDGHSQLPSRENPFRLTKDLSTGLQATFVQ
jgi:hypothetical protein